MTPKGMITTTTAATALDGTFTTAGAEVGGGPPLVDRQRRLIDYLRVSVTDRCNYRCTYCLPAEGAPHARREDILSFEQIARLVSCFVRLGVHRVRLTGGEPTVRRDLPALVRLLRRIPGIDDLALSTNGHLLFEMAAPLREAGVDRLNVSIDTLDPDRFREVTRGGDLARVLAGIEAARAVGFSTIKLNAVAVRGFNDDQLAGLCAYAWERDMVPRFIEQMPMADGALFVPGTLMTAAEIRAAIATAFSDGHVSADRSSPIGGGPARYWRVDTAPGSARLTSVSRRFGVISPISEHFCDTCNRVRLSASGALHTCLAHDAVTDLRAALTDGGDDAVVAAIRGAVAGKRDGHTFGLIGLGGPRKAMIQIGG